MDRRSPGSPPPSASALAGVKFRVLTVAGVLGLMTAIAGCTQGSSPSPAASSAGGQASGAPASSAGQPSPSAPSSGYGY